MYRLLWLCLLQVLSGLAIAACSRDIVVPFSEQGVDQWHSAGKRLGLSIDFLEEVSQRTGCRFVYIDVPRARAWWMFARGQADMVLGAVRNAWRDKFGMFYGQHAYEAVSLISLKTRSLQLNFHEAILESGLTFAFVRGHDYGPKTANLIKTLASQDRLVLAKDPSTMLRMLQAGRVNGAIVLASTVTVDALHLGLDDALTGIVVDNLDWTTSGLYLSQASLAPEDEELLARALIELNSEGFYTRLAQEPLRKQPAWVQASIRLDHRPTPLLYWVERKRTSQPINWPTLHDPHR